LVASSKSKLKICLCRICYLGYAYMCITRSRGAESLIMIWKWH